jgi:hypothetical protein
MMHSAPRWWARLGVIALLLVAVLAQTLGLVHRTVHSGHQHGYPAVRVLMQDSAHDHEHHHDHGTDLCDESAPSWLERLFSDHQSGVTCAVYDAQTTVYGSFTPVVHVFVAQAAILLIAFSRITSTARAAALFEARGPPAAL